jgi:hypothetical protein
VQVLLDKRADVNAKRNDGTTALMLASKNRRDVVQTLVQAGAKAPTQSSPSQKQPTLATKAPEITSAPPPKAPPPPPADDLLKATENGDEATVQALPARGADVQEEQRLLEIGIRALKESIVLGEIWCKDKATAEALVADETKVKVSLALSEAAGKITPDDCVDALRAFRKGKYEVVPSRNGGFVVMFFGTPSKPAPTPAHAKLFGGDPRESEILAEIKEQIDLCLASQSLSLVAAGRGKPKTEEQLNRLIGDNAEAVARRVMPKYGVSQEQFADLYARAASTLVYCPTNN